MNNVEFFTLKEKSILMIILLCGFLFACKQGNVKSSSVSNTVTIENSILYVDSISEQKEYLFEKLSPIREKVKMIDSIKDWSKILTKEILESTEGGEATYYYSNSNDKRIKYTEYGEIYQRQVNYYLTNDSLIYVYEKITKYNRPIYYDSSVMIEMNDTEFFDINKSIIIETENYFEDEKIIRIITNQDCGAPASENLREIEGIKLLIELEFLINYSKPNY